MVGACLVGPSSVGGQHDSQPIVIKVFESVGQSTDFFDDQVDGFGAAVADAVGVEVGQDLAFQARRVRPSLATSGIGQVWKLSNTLIAIWRPFAGVAW